MTTDAPTGARLRFLTGWRTVREGMLTAGGSVTIEYDPERLTGCRGTMRGAQMWDIEINVAIHPRGGIVRGSAMEKVRVPPERGMVVNLLPKPYRLEIPRDATRLELWFRNYHGGTSPCETWDSRFGQNYVFDVEPA